MSAGAAAPPPLGGSRGPRFSGPGRLLRSLAPTGLSLLVVLVFLVIAFLYAICSQYIHPDEFAVKQVDVPVPFFTGAAGIHSNIYQTGVQWRLPGCEKFIIFPKSVRAVTLHAKGKLNEDQDKFVRYEDAAHIQTSDGFFINLDVSILYRVMDPYKVVREFGAGSLYEQNGIVFQAETFLKSTMEPCIPRIFLMLQSGSPNRKRLAIVSMTFFSRAD